MKGCGMSKKEVAKKMPLKHGKEASSPKGFAANLKREEKLGRPEKQSVKVAYVEAERGKKKKK